MKSNIVLLVIASLFMSSLVNALSKDEDVQSLLLDKIKPNQNQEPPKNIREDKNPFSLAKISNLEAKLYEKVYGQNQAIKKTVYALLRHAYKLNDPNTPVASLLYTGPSGVGKTKLVKELARCLLGNEENIITFNLADFTDDDYDFFAQTLEKMPYGIVHLQGVDEANAATLKFIRPIFERGSAPPYEHKPIDCRNFIFILETNLEAETVSSKCNDGFSEAAILEAIKLKLINHFTFPFYSCLSPVIFKTLNADALTNITQTALSDFSKKLKKHNQIDINYDPSIYDFFKKQPTHSPWGAWFILHLIKQTIEDCTTEAICVDYLASKESAVLHYHNANFIISNSARDSPFLWEWKINSEKESPFRLNNLTSLENKLNNKILGQPHAVSLTVAALMRYAAGVRNTNAPIASFLFVGPTGVGKTQLAKELAKELLGSETHLVRLDMSEYSEPHTISRLIGSPPGYVGSDEGGQLTEALKLHPYAVVLLDEVEKAHPQVLKTFLQVFDEGRLTDAQGTTVDCRNVIFIMTTNLGAQTILDLHELGYEPEQILATLQPELMHFLSPELYNRTDAVTFMGMSQELIDALVLNMLKDFQEDLKDKKNISVEFDPSVIDFLKTNGFDYASGARPLKRLILNAIVTPIAQKIVTQEILPGDSLAISYKNQELCIRIDNHN